MFVVILFFGSLIFLVAGFIFVGYKKAKDYNFDAVEGALIAVAVGLFWWWIVPCYLLYRLGRLVGGKSES